MNHTIHLITYKPWNVKRWQKMNIVEFNNSFDMNIVFLSFFFSFEWCFGQRYSYINCDGEYVYITRARSRPKNTHTHSRLIARTYNMRTAYRRMSALHIGARFIYWWLKIMRVSVVVVSSLPFLAIKVNVLLCSVSVCD